MWYGSRSELLRAISSEIALRSSLKATLCSRSCDNLSIILTCIDDLKVLGNWVEYRIEGRSTDSDRCLLVRSERPTKTPLLKRMGNLTISAIISNSN